MSSNFRMQKPYELTSFPRSHRHLVVGEVFGLHDGGRKRKRPEVTIGIDGDSLCLYDVSSSKQLTSYDIRPDWSFTCPPVSTRSVSSGTKDVNRYTYTATCDSAGQSIISCFKNAAEPPLERILPASPAIIYLASISVPQSTVLLSNATPPHLDVVAVATNGQIYCLDGETLHEKWSAPPGILSQGQAQIGCRVHFAQTASATELMSGMFGTKQDMFNIFPQKVQDGGFNPPVLALVTSVTTEDAILQYLHVLSLASTDSFLTTGTHPATHLLSLPISSMSPDKAPANLWRLDISSGSLLELRPDTVNLYDLRDTVPRLQHELHLSGASSLLRLSKTSLLAATRDSLAVYNPLYQSLQASTILLPSKTPSEANTAPKNDEQPCTLVTYFSRLQLAIALVGSSLVAIQLEAPKLRERKRRADGLLIDAIGCGIPLPHADFKKRKTGQVSSVFSKYLPGSVSERYWSSFISEVQRADDLLSQGDLAGFERLLADKFGVQLHESETLLEEDIPQTGQVEGNTPAKTRAQADLPEWLWPTVRSRYPKVDRRWLLYALSRTFSWHGTSADSARLHLRCDVPESNILSYLIDSKHLTVSNLVSALREDAGNDSFMDETISEELPQVIAEIDPTMDLLSRFLSSAHLEAKELLTAVRVIMRSLELIQDPAKMSQNLLTSGADADGQCRDDGAAGEIGVELDMLEREIEMTEYHLGDDSSTRAQALSVAFAKLAGCPAVSTVRAMRGSLNAQELLSLIYLLRVELVKDGWTTRYLDANRLDDEEESEAPPDGSVKLISDLLCRCVDSLGPGGWLMNDTILAGDHVDSGDFISSLKLEVSAALEGIEEAVYLRGILAEVVRYSSSLHVAALRHVPAGQEVTAKVTPISVRLDGTNSQMLPLGMRPAQRFSNEKVVSGGEVVRRSRREVGHLTSKKIGSYSLDRIMV